MKPFFDHVISFSMADGCIWLRNYQVSYKRHCPPQTHPSTAVHAQLTVLHAACSMLHVHIAQFWTIVVAFVDISPQQRRHCCLFITLMCCGASACCCNHHLTHIHTRTNNNVHAYTHGRLCCRWIRSVLTPQLPHLLRLGHVPHCGLFEYLKAVLGAVLYMTTQSMWRPTSCGVWQSGRCVCTAAHGTGRQQGATSCLQKNHPIATAHH